MNNLFRFFLTLMITFSLGFGMAKIPKNVVPVEPPDPTIVYNEYVSNVIKFMAWSKEVAAIEIDLKHGVIYNDTQSSDYTKRNDAKAYVQVETYWRSIVLDVKSEVSHHYFYNNGLTNDSYVMFYPEQMMLTIRVPFTPMDSVYFYEANIFWMTGKMVNGEMVYDGILNSYSKSYTNVRGLVIISFPIKTKMILEKNPDVEKNSTKPVPKEKPKSRSGYQETSIRN